MKKRITTSVTVALMLLFATSGFGQTVWIANNNPNAPTGSNVFPTIQEAVDAASAGDIVQVQPSPITYGSVSINKQITLLGIGFNLDKDIPLTSNMGSITLTNNVDGTSEADGTIIKGLSTSAINLGAETGPDFVLENILIQNCSIGYIYIASGSTYSPSDNVEIRDNYIWGSTSGWGIYLYKYVNNYLIRNNLIINNIGFFQVTPGVNIVTNNILYGNIRIDSEGSNTTIINNDFIGATGSGAFNSNLRDCIVANNIFYGVTPSVTGGGNSTSGTFQRNVFTNNLAYSTGNDAMPPSGGGASNSGSGNLVGSPLFVDVQLLNTWSSAYDFTLQGGSPALSAGSDGTDIGISGGSYPMTGTNFVLKTTAAPVIQILNTSTVINPGDDLPVRVKANAN